MKDRPIPPYHCCSNKTRVPWAVECILPMLALEGCPSPPIIPAPSRAAEGVSAEQAKRGGRLVWECLVSTPKVGSRKREVVLINSFSTLTGSPLLDFELSPISIGMAQ